MNARMYGMKKSCVPNADADKRFKKNAFLHQKGIADNALSRADRKSQKKGLSK